LQGGAVDVKFRPQPPKSFIDHQNRAPAKQIAGLKIEHTIFPSPRLKEPGKLRSFFHWQLGIQIAKHRGWVTMLTWSQLQRIWSHLEMILFFSRCFADRGLLLFWWN